MMNIIDKHIVLEKLGKIIIYLRKSREDMIDGRYASDEETLSRHEEQLQNWARNNLGYEIPQENIFKEVVSGEKISSRPVFRKVLEMVEKEDIDGILCINCSRLSRGDLVDCGNLIKILEITKTLVLTPSKVYNLQNKYDKRFFKDELLRGNDYLEQVKELLVNGRHWSTAQGKFVGSKAPYGYDKVTCKEMNVADGRGYTLRPNDNAKYVKMIFDMFLEGNGTYKIATHLININAPLINDKQWDHCKVKKILNNETYSGYLTWGKRQTQEKIVDGEVVQIRSHQKEYPIYKGLQEAIIDEETFNKVQLQMQSNKTTPVKHEFLEKNPLAGLVKCGVCGRAMIRQTHYDCITRKRKHDLDKVALQDFIKSYKAKTTFSNAEIARRLDIKRHYANEWFGKNPDKFHPSDVFVEKWFDLKSLLNIDDDKFDKSVTEYIDHVKYETFICSGHRCGNVSSNLYIVEDAIIEKIKERYSNYKYILDNYEVEYTKRIKSVKQTSKDIDKKIAMIEKQLKNVKIAYEQEAYTLQEFIERKKELNNELDELMQEKEKAKNTQEEDKFIVIKKSIPILENVFENYYTLDAASRNKLLKTIIESVMYVKKKNYTNCGNNKEVLKNIDLDICWYI